MDADSYVVSPSPNLVTFMDSHELYLITGKQSEITEARGYYMGLPELALLWLVRITCAPIIDVHDRCV